MEGRLSRRSRDHFSVCPELLLRAAESLPTSCFLGEGKHASGQMRSLRAAPAQPVRAAASGSGIRGAGHHLPPRSSCFQGKAIPAWAATLLQGPGSSPTPTTEAGQALGGDPAALSCGRERRERPRALCPWLCVFGARRVTFSLYVHFYDNSE